MAGRSAYSRTHRNRACAASGLTLVEAIISTALVGIVVAGALTCAAQTFHFRRIGNDHQIANGLGQQLMAEILSKAYWEPESTTPTEIGMTMDEASTGDRSLFNDVDDYNGWIESPCTLQDGGSIANTAGWYRKVEVEFVDLPAIDTPVASDCGLKRITIEVGRVRAGGSAGNANDRLMVTRIRAIAGRGRGL